HLFCCGVSVGKAVRTGAGVGSTGVEDDSFKRAVLDHLFAPDDRRRLDPVRGEDCGGRLERAEVADQSQVRPAGRLEAGGDASSEESLCSGGAHGATPIMVSPKVSSK